MKRGGKIRAKKVHRLSVSPASTASAEQSQGVSEISKAINQLDQATQEDSSSASRVSNVARQLNASAEYLGGLLGQRWLLDLALRRSLWDGRLSLNLDAGCFVNRDERG